MEQGICVFFSLSSSSSSSKSHFVTLASFPFSSLFCFLGTIPVGLRAPSADRVIIHDRLVWIIGAASKMGFLFFFVVIPFFPLNSILSLDRSTLRVSRLVYVVYCCCPYRENERERKERNKKLRPNNTCRMVVLCRAVGSSTSFRIESSTHQSFFSPSPLALSASKPF